MASFPAIPPSEGSFLDPRDGRVEDAAGDGTARIRKLFAGRKGTFKLKFILDQAERDTLVTFCDANETATIDFTWIEDGLTYQVKIGKGGLRIKPGQAERRDAEIDLVIVS